MGINTFGAYEGGDILRRGLNNKQLQETDTHEGVLHLQGLLLRANKAAKRLTGDKEPVCRGKNVKVKLQIQERISIFPFIRECTYKECVNQTLIDQIINELIKDQIK